MQPPDTLRTARLVLRSARVDDAQTVFDTYATDPEVTRYLTWSPHGSVEETKVFLRSREDANAGGRDLAWLAWDAAGGLVGTVALNLSGHRASLGYLVARSFWGRGYATEMGSGAVDWALDQPGIWRAWAVCDVENPASARVLQKVAMEYEGVLHRWIMHPNISSEPRDCHCYARVR